MYGMLKESEKELYCMAAQYIDRNEFTNGLNALYAKITRYIDNRFEGLNGQILADKTDTSERLDRVEKRSSVLSWPFSVEPTTSKSKKTVL